MKSILQYLKENLGKISIRTVVHTTIFMICVYLLSNPKTDINKFLDAVGAGAIKLYEVFLLFLPLIISFEILYCLGKFVLENEEKFETKSKKKKKK